MFKLSSRGDYGLMLLRHLAGLKKGQYATLRSIARCRRLPLRYLEQLAGDLLAADVLISKEGRCGGYTLAQSPAKLKLSRVLTVLENGLKPIHCTHDGKCCARLSACERKTGYYKIHAKLYDLLKNYSLADILRDIK